MVWLPVRVLLPEPIRMAQIPAQYSGGLGRPCPTEQAGVEHAALGNSMTAEVLQILFNVALKSWFLGRSGQRVIGCPCAGSSGKED